MAFSGAQLCGFGTRLFLAAAIPSLAGLLWYCISCHLSKPFCPTYSSSPQCAPCPARANCTGGSHFFDCELGYFQLYRICARPGAYISRYTPEIHAELHHLQRQIFRIASARSVTAADVAAEFSERPEAILRRLDETDVVNIWTYEGQNYWIDADGVLRAEPHRTLPGFWTVSALIVATVFVFVLLLS
jgi:hypothetical protein